MTTGALESGRGSLGGNCWRQQRESDTEAEPLAMFPHPDDLIRHEHHLREQDALNALIRTVAARQARAER
ncbi:hypothetical protein, partial [Phytoactinopolyspora endophytica]|uniref:hypothetical protein n=1 Tax=Phytoactinopolyspora endophytica TaxID=1642495 RepID=UPI00197BA2C9